MAHVSLTPKPMSASFPGGALLALDLGTTTGWALRAADSLDPASQEALLAWCKGDHPPSDDDLDARIAQSLLDYRDLFQQAFNASRIALSERPEAKQ